jgi:hypothetical protein
LKAYIDGKEVKVLNDVKVVWEGDCDLADQSRDNHLTLTYEGAILDIVRNEVNSESPSEIEETQSVEVYDLFCTLFRSGYV